MKTVCVSFLLYDEVPVLQFQAVSAEMELNEVIAL